MYCGEKLELLLDHFNYALVEHNADSDITHLNEFTSAIYGATGMGICKSNGTIINIGATGIIFNDDKEHMFWFEFELTVTGTGATHLFMPAPARWILK